MKLKHNFLFTGNRDGGSRGGGSGGGFRGGMSKF